MNRRWRAAVCVVVLGLVWALAPVAAQAQTAPETLWAYTGVEHFTPACAPGSGAVVEVAGNQLTYTYTYAAEPHNPTVMRFTWEPPVLNGATITGYVRGHVLRQGSPSVTPAIRMLMYTAPSAYQVKGADVSLSGAFDPAVTVGENFEAHANPDPNWTAPFHVGV